MDYISSAWPWYIAGPLIAFTMFSMLYLGRRFGISSSMETICTIGGAGRISNYFNRNWKDKDWLLLFVMGTIIGGYLASNFLSDPKGLILADNTISDLAALGIQFEGSYLPADIFSWDNLGTGQGIIMMMVGGLLVGFGTRYAGGCTSGHAISGLSELQLPSLVATIGFFIGGLISTYFLLPLIF